MLVSQARPRDYAHAPWLDYIHLLGHKWGQESSWSAVCRLKPAMSLDLMGDRAVETCYIHGSFRFPSWQCSASPAAATEWWWFYGSFYSIW